LAKITALFWDVGGVLLTDAWDRSQRKKAIERFALDEEEFDERHIMLVSSFERGKISLDRYLAQVIFYCPRAFTIEEFKHFMFSLSKPTPPVLKFAHSLSQTRQFLMATINNESLELNAYRIHTFGLRQIFSLFISSCFVGLRKPEEGIYQLALNLTQKRPEECCFVDDRALNLDCASRLGMRVIRMEDLNQLRRELAGLGVEA